MNTFPQTTNSVHVKMIPNGFFTAVFDSTYPVQLNGIISQDEFQKSINTINQKIASNRMLDFSVIISMLCTIAGIILLVIGLEGTDTGADDPEMAMAGLILFFVGLIFSLVVHCVTSCNYVTKMQQAVTEESMKYHSGSSTSLNWRILDARYGTPVNGNFRKNKTIYAIEIEIGSSVTPENGTETYSSYQNSTESTMVSEP